MRVIDIDRIEYWERWVTEILQSVAPEQLFEDLRTGSFEYMEDAADVVLRHVDRASLIKALRIGLREVSVRLYHGTRLSDVAISSVDAYGLQPLVLANRREEIVEALSRHPDWQQVSHRLDEALERYAPCAAAGLREDGNIHVCFSRNGLLRGCSHYLTHGAEVDSQIASFLFNGDQCALDCFVKTRRPFLITFIKPFELTLQAANPFGFPANDLPSLISLLINCWSYRQANPDFVPSRLLDCTAAMFKGPLDRGNLEQIIPISDCDLNWDN